MPVIAFMSRCWKEQDTDVSLIRHFITEVNLKTLKFLTNFI